MSIVVKDLIKSFDGFEAVANVSFHVREGEFVSLLGPSGSGKSTILRCIAGLEEPDYGTIEISGQDVTHIPVQQRKVGFVFQHYALFKHMTLCENIAFGLKVRGIEKDKRNKRATELLDLVGLSGMGGRMPSQLSGGQRQRVALARALAPEPGLLLLDEPFGALDTRLRKELRVWLKSLHDRIGLTTVLVTHDQEEAFELSNRIIVVNNGKLEQDDVPPEIFNKPATQFVASFVGETNRALGVVEEGTLAWGPFRFKAVHLSEGTKAVSVFRPHDVYVTTKKEDGGWPGILEDIQFMGAFDLLVVNMGNGLRISASIPRGVSSLSKFEKGKTVYIMVTNAHVFAT